MPKQLSNATCLLSVNLIKLMTNYKALLRYIKIKSIQKISSTEYFSIFLYDSS